MPNEHKAHVGEAGEPGQPGGNAGNFYGIGGTFRGGKLQVTADGGHGSAGQDGGDGAKGADAERLNKPYYVYENQDEECSAWESGKIWVKSSPYGYRCEWPEWMSTTSIPDLVPILLGAVQIPDRTTGCWSGMKFTYFGQPGKSGGKGGDGGKGGEGGHGGLVNLFTVGQKSGSLLSSRMSLKQGWGAQGRAGADGQGGQGGQGGRSGDNMIFTLVSTRPSIFNSHHCHVIDGPYYETNWTTGPTGANGTTGRNSEGQEHFSPPSLSGSSHAVNFRGWIRFKENVRTLLSGKKDFILFKTSLLRLVEEGDRVVESNIGTPLLGLYEELISLERQFFVLRHLPPDTFFTPFYTSLLHRIQDKMKMARGEGGETPGLTFLYAATLTKLSSLRSSFEPFLVVNLQEFLKLAQDNIDALRSTADRSQRLSIIRKSRDAYGAKIQERIDEAHRLVELIIQPEIEKVHRQIENNIQTLVQEIAELEKVKDTEGEELERKKKTLQYQQRMGIRLDFLKIGAALLSSVDFTGNILSAGAQAGIGLAEGLYKDKDADAKINIAKLPPAIKNLRADFALSVNTKLGGFSQQLADARQIVQNTKNISNTGNSSSLVLTGKIQRLEQKVKNAIAKRTAELNQDRIPGFLEDGGDTEGDKLIEEIKAKLLMEFAGNKSGGLLVDSVGIKEGDAEKIKSILNTPSEIYAKYRESKDQLEVVKAQMEQNKEEKVMLQAHKVKVIRQLVPFVAKIEKDMGTFMGALGNQSATALIVSKWQVTTVLREIRGAIQAQFTEGFQVDAEMGRCFTLLEEGITTAIQIYDGIVNYGDQIKLSVYIASMNEAALARTKYNVSDPQLEVAMEQTDKIIQTNILLTQYKSAISSFSMQVFPFSHLYMADFSLAVPSPTLKGGNLSLELRELANSAGKDIEKLRTKLSIHGSSIITIDQHVHNKQFLGSNTNSDSFFVWGDSHLISDILEGKKVTLFADVRKSPGRMDAIKFRNLELRFKIGQGQYTPQKGQSQGQGHGQHVDLENQLATELNCHFLVNMTHLGNSYYRFENKIYVISSRALSLTFTFAKGTDGRPKTTNEVYDKLDKGQVSLSPYALWEIQIVPQPKAPAPATVLKRFSSYAGLTLELNGAGSFVSPLPGKNRLELNKYYKLAENLPSNMISG